jgi:multicomponent Na+:H+ antiporter subunit F
MNMLLLFAAAFILVMIALGLLRVLRGPGSADRLMAAQLIGSGGVAVLVLLSAAMEISAIVDVALMLAVLAVFASVGFVNWGAGSDGHDA